MLWTFSVRRGREINACGGAEWPKTGCRGLGAFMQAMVAGTCRLPWESEVKVTDGTSCGFPVL